MKQLFVYSAILLLLAGFASCEKEEANVMPPPPDPPEDNITYNPSSALKAVANYPIGLAIQSGKINVNEYQQIATGEFNSYTSEYEMKQNIMLPAQDSYNWINADAIVNFAKSNGSRVHGHTLIWHSSIPPWLENYSGDSATFEMIIKDYIKTVVDRYKDDIESWDVVNEAFNDGDGQLRNTLFRKWMGDDYVARCFQYAREADPDLLLFYNDYGAIWDPNKLNAILNMINDFQSRGIPIDGFGFQMHITDEWPAISNIKNAIDAVVATGLKIHFSELDIRVNADTTLTELTDEAALSQQQRYREIVALYETIPDDQQFGITMWGMRDNESWLIPFWGQEDWPLLFNEDYQFKIAHKGFIEGLQ